jgi:hypothetical protein
MLKTQKENVFYWYILSKSAVCWRGRPAEKKTGKSNQYDDDIRMENNRCKKIKNHL